MIFKQPEGQLPVSRKSLDSVFLTGPGEVLVEKTLKALSSIPGFVKIYGTVELDPKKPQTNNRVVTYNREDWALRQLPVMNVFHTESEDKTSDNGWLTGNVSLMMLWPASLRRSDLTEVPLAMKAALENFFASRYVHDMMDRHPSLYTDSVVPGLNEYGKQLSWLPNAEAILEKEKVPATILKARYRIDLRAWYRWLEAQGRSKADPFEVTLDKLAGYSGGILGMKDDNQTVAVVVPEGLNQNPL